jgi:hypothetical protein
MHDEKEGVEFLGNAAPNRTTGIKVQPWHGGSKADLLDPGNLPAAEGNVPLAVRLFVLGKNLWGVKIEALIRLQRDQWSFQFRRTCWLTVFGLHLSAAARRPFRLTRTFHAFGRHCRVLF